MAKDMLVSATVKLDEAALVEQARGGDMIAFSQLVSRYQDRVLNACWRICGRLEDAQDLTQEAFLRAMQSIGSFRQDAGFYTWIFRIAVNLSISHRRKALRAVRLSLHDGDGMCIDEYQAGRLPGRDSAPDPSARLSAQETQRRILQGLDELDEDHRAAIVLRDIEGLDYQQIADILEVPIGTVKSRLHRGRMELRERLKAVVSDEKVTK